VVSLYYAARTPGEQHAISKEVVSFPMKSITIATLLVFATVSVAQNPIPSGTILPVKLSSSLNSKTSIAGEKIIGSLGQDVPLASGSKIHAGAKLVGHIIAVNAASKTAGARLSFEFDTLRTTRLVSLTTDLRAIASMMEIYEAQLPEMGPDRGTPETAWVTEQIGGETNYHGEWPITNGSTVVGESLLSGGVLARISSMPGSKCRGEIDGNDQPQALWLFASNACGTYGFADLAISHAGRTEPVGQIVLTSETRNIDVRSGSGMLLRVIHSSN
jgi:hypothetical protein